MHDTQESVCAHIACKTAEDDGLCGFQSLRCKNSHHKQEVKMFSLKYALWAALAGGLIPLMGVFNARLGGALGSPNHAPVILFVVAFATALGACLAITQRLPDLSKLATASPQDFVGGLIVCFYVFSITLLAPRMGIGNFILFALCAQLVMAAAIDYFGLFGAPVKDISLQRLGGIVTMLVGLAVAQSSV